MTTFGVKNTKDRVVFKGDSDIIPLKLGDQDPEPADEYGDEDWEYC
jgi:hypothetical protein